MESTIEPISKNDSNQFPTRNSFSLLDQTFMSRFYNTLKKIKNWKELGGGVRLFLSSFLPQVFMHRKSFLMNAKHKLIDLLF